MKILHVSESYGGGVTSAINSYAKNSPQFEHFLFVAPRKKDLTGEEGGCFYSEVVWAERSWRAIFKLYESIKRINPDVIHIHSTYAGVICRLLPFIAKKKTVYTPHGYAFLRDDHPVLLWMFSLVERLLSKRTQLIAGCGRDERDIAAKFIGDGRAFELINVCDPLECVTEIKSETHLPVIGMIGRVSNQKGYGFFLETAQALQGKAYFKWIGGGESEYEALMQNEGVEVTGWITRAEVVGHLKGLDLYYHTAAWEGFPISVLEASQLNKSILLREIGSFSAEGLPTVSNVKSACRTIDKWLNKDADVIQQTLDVSTQVNEYHSLDHLQYALNKLYTSFSK